MKQVFPCRLGTPGSFALDQCANPFNGRSWVPFTTVDRMQCPWPVTGVLRNLYITLAAAATGTQTFRIRINGVNSSMIVAITSGNSTGSYTAGDISVTAGDVITLTVVGAGTPQFVHSSLEFDSTAEAESGYATSASAEDLHTTEARYNGALRGDRLLETSEAHASRNVAAIAGTLTAGYFRLEDAPGSGNSFTLQVVKNGTLQDGSGSTVDTTVTIADTDVSASATFSLPIAVGDLLSVKITPVSSPGVGRCQYAFRFVAEEDGYSHYCGRTTSTLPLSSTGYNEITYPGGTNAWGATEGDFSTRWDGSTAFDLRGLVIAGNASPGTGDALTLTGRVNADTPTGGPSVTLTGSATAGSDDGTMPVVQGDLLTIQAVPTGAPNTVAYTWAFGMYLQPTIVPGGDNPPLTEAQLSRFFEFANFEDPNAHFPTETYMSHLRQSGGEPYLWFVCGEFEHIYTQLAGYLSVQHKQGGGHKDITADSISIRGLIRERGRSVGMGVWDAVAFAAGNFTGNNSMTWTVASADQLVFRVMKIGLSAWVNFDIDDTTVGGTPSTALQITLPVTASVSGAGAFIYDDNAGGNRVGQWRISAGSATLQLLTSDESNWTASTNATRVRGTIMVELSR